MKAKVTDTDPEIVQDHEKDIIILEDVGDLTVEKENIETIESVEIITTNVENVAEAAKEITEEKTNTTMIDTNIVNTKVEENDPQEMTWNVEVPEAIPDQTTKIVIVKGQGINEKKIASYYSDLNLNSPFQNPDFESVRN